MEQVHEPLSCLCSLCLRSLRFDFGLLADENQTVGWIELLSGYLVEKVNYMFIIGFVGIRFSGAVGPSSLISCLVKLGF